MLLYDYLDSRKIPYNKCGKLIVATNDDEVLSLNNIMKQAQNNNVNDLLLLDSNDVNKLEPEITCKKAILSPSTGVFDSSTYVQHLVNDIETNNGNIIYNCSVNNINQNNSNNLFEIITNQGSIVADIVVNAAGMHAPMIASKINVYPKENIPKQFYSKGNYFKIQNGNQPKFKRLVYPVPSNGGLGIHATIDMNNDIKFGPDSEWLMPKTSSHNDNIIDSQYIFTEPPAMTEFQVNSDRSLIFDYNIRKYWPLLSHNSLVPDFAGIRPCLCGPSSKEFDFIIETKSHHNIKNLINLYGISSPGLTSSLAIGHHIKNILLD